MVPVKLRGAADERNIENDLDEQASSYVAAEREGDTLNGQEDVILARLQQITASVKVHLRTNVELSEELLKETVAIQRGKRKRDKKACSTSGEADRAHSADALGSLENEVAELATRIQAHRTDVPQRIAQRLSEHLQSIRPSATSADPPETDAHLSAQELEPILGLPSLEELQEKVVKAAAALPALRRRLEVAEARMERVVTAVEQEKSRGGPSLTEQVIAEHDQVTGYLEDKSRGRGTKRAATALDLGSTPAAKVRSKP